VSAAQGRREDQGRFQAEVNRLPCAVSRDDLIRGENMYIGGGVIVLIIIIILVVFLLRR
jgi:hypothetical protein